MQYQIGDKVVHQVYGVGEIVQYQEKTFSGQTAPYYEVRIRDLTLWVPTEQDENHSLRLPTPTKDFNSLFDILSSSPQPLPTDRLERKSWLTTQLRSAGLAGICRVIRDLSSAGQVKSLYDAEKGLLERAQNLLLDEWALALKTPRMQAEAELKQLLGRGSAGNDGAK